MNPFLNKHCRDYSKNESALSRQQVDQQQQYIPEWRFHEPKNRLQRCVEFDNYQQTLAFVNAVAKIAIEQDHHPEIQFTYKQCTIYYSTHSLDGISNNDFICASKIDVLLQST